MRVRREMIEMGWVAFVTFDNHRIRRVLAASICAIGVTALASCATSIPSQTLALRISNELGRDIAEIRRKSCGDLDMAFEPIEDSRIPSGASREIPLPRTCIDVVAFDARGRIVGEQRRLKMLPGASWVLRK